MRQKVFPARTVRQPIIILLVLLCLVFVNATPVLALSISDFFSYTYTAQFSKTEITGSESFSITVDGRATCSKDLPLPVSEAEVTGRIVAKHEASGTNVILNPSFTVTLSPVPSKAGETAQASRVVPAQFPAGSQSGSYRVIGVTTEAKVKALIWFDVTQYVPSSQTLGSITYMVASIGGGGGGGGGAPPSPPVSVSPGTTVVSGYVGADGIFTQTIVAPSVDGKCQLTINEGTKGLTQENALLTKLVVTEAKAPPTPPEHVNIIGLTYDIGPDGATFEPPITLTITYEPNSIPQGVNEKNLTVAMWDANTSAWVKLESTVDPAAHTISTPVRHFTNFTILAYTRPSAFTVSNLSITPLEVGTTGPVTISVVVTNTGDLTGSYKVSLKIDNAVVETKEVTLDGGNKQQVTFTVARDVPQRYSVTIDSLSGAFVVTAPPTPSPSPTPVPSPAPAPAMPATFTTSNLAITPTEVNIGEAVTIGVLVTNTGDLPGSYKVSLKIDNTVVATKDIPLAGGAKQQVTFTTTKDVAGSYNVTIDRLSGVFVVKAPALPLQLPEGWWLIGGIAAAVMLIVLVTWRLATPRAIY